MIVASGGRWPRHRRWTCEGWPWGMGQRPMYGPRTTAGPAHGAQAAPGRATSWARLALAMRGEPPPFDKHGPGWPMRWPYPLHQLTEPRKTRLHRWGLSARWFSCNPQFSHCLGC